MFNLNFFFKNYKNIFIKHSFNYLIAEFFNKAVIFFTIPFFTRLLLPAEYGIISLFNSLIMIFSIIIGLNIQGAVARRFYEKDNDFSSFLGSILIFTVLFNFVLITILFLFKKSLSSFFQISSDLFFYAVIVSFLGIFIQIELSYLQARQMSKKYAIITVCRNSVITITAVIWVYLLKTDRYMGQIYAQIIITFIISSYVIYSLVKISKVGFKLSHIKYALLFSVPLIPHTLSGIILAHFDKIIINQVSGTFETGLYSFAYNIGMIMNVFVMSTTKAWIPILYNNLNESKYDEIQSLAIKYSKVVFGIALFLILFSKEIVMIMADKKYFEALQIVPIIVISYVFVFLYTLFGSYAFYKKKTWTISLFTFIAGFTNIGLNYVFIPKYGYIAAAWTTLASYIFLFILHYLNSKFILKMNVIKIKNIIIDLFIMISFSIAYIFIIFENYFLQFVFKFFLILVLLLLYFGRVFIKRVKK